MTPPSNEPVPFANRPAPADIDIQLLIDVAVERAIDRLLASHLSRLGPHNPTIRPVEQSQQPSVGRGATPVLGPLRTASAWGARPDGLEEAPPGMASPGDAGGSEQANRTATRQPNRTVKVPEAARMLGISRSHAYDLVHRGELVGVRLGRRIVVPISAIDEMLASGSAEAG